MQHVIDPRPQVEESLRKLAAEYKPRLAELRDAVKRAPDRSHLLEARRRLKECEKRYRTARREVKAILRAPVVW
ncbi:MAG TPA: hypothetical protein VGJ86_22735 [Acidimicrobiales bacterium]|jgi:hypothetical protein